MKVFIDNSKNFYKVNLHCHTVNSDGKLTPEEIKAEYKKRGYSAVAFTDHEHLIDHSHLTDDSFIAITGCELAIKENTSSSTLTSTTMKATHLCIYAFDPHNTLTPCYNSVADHFITPSAEGKVRYEGEYQRTYGADCINDMIRTCHEKGFLVCYNHPGWSLESAAEYLGYEGADLIEIVNTGSIVKGLYDDEAAFAEMLRAGKRIFCTAADDNHNRQPLDSPHSDSFGGFVMVCADSLDYGSLMNAIAKGDFYASEAPLIHSVTMDDEYIRISCSAAKKISILSLGRRTAAEHAVDTPLTEAKFPAEKYADGFRIRIEDANGKKAYSQFFKA